MLFSCVCRISMMTVVSRERKLKSRRGDVFTSTATRSFFQRLSRGRCYETREIAMPVQTPHHRKKYCRSQNYAKGRTYFVSCTLSVNICYSPLSKLANIPIDTPRERLHDSNFTMLPSQTGVIWLYRRVQYYI